MTSLAVTTDVRRTVRVVLTDSTLPKDGTPLLGWGQLISVKCNPCSCHLVLPLRVSVAPQPRTLPPPLAPHAEPHSRPPRYYPIRWQYTKVSKEFNSSSSCFLLPFYFSHLITLFPLNCRMKHILLIDRTSQLSNSTNYETKIRYGFGCVCGGSCDRNINISTERYRASTIILLYQR